MKAKPAKPKTQVVVAAETANPTEPVDYLKFWESHAGIEVQYLIHVDKGYIVWLDNEGDVDWQTTEAQDAAIDAKVSIADQNEVFNLAAYVNSIPVEHLSDVQRRSLRIMIGAGFARLLSGDAKCAMEMMQHAEAFAKARNAEIARGWQIVALCIPALLSTLVLLVLWYNRINCIQALGRLGFILCAGFCAGAIGAAFSVLSRSGSFSLDPSAGKKLHFLEGFSRALAGSIGAVMAQLAVELAIFLGIFAKGTPGLMFVALIAGVSERLVPNLVKGVENDGVASLKGSAKPAKDQKH